MHQEHADFEVQRAFGSLHEYSASVLRPFFASFEILCKDQRYDRSKTAKARLCFKQKLIGRKRGEIDE